MIDLLLGRYPHSGFLQGRVSRASDNGALSRVGFIVNHKFCLVLAQQFRFLGFDWDTVSGFTSINDVKRLNLLTHTSKMALDAFPQCQDI